MKTEIIALIIMISAICGAFAVNTFVFETLINLNMRNSYSVIAYGFSLILLIVLFMYIGIKILSKLGK